ncbi:hypothetical protein MASR2M15_01120 [Anaerolineales bacterium]
MIELQNALVSGEHIVGQYVVQFMRQASTGWALDILQLQAAVTQYRLLIKPFPRRYKPASIPHVIISNVDTERLEGHYVIRIQIQNHYLLRLAATPLHAQDLADDLRIMQLPRPQFHADLKVSTQEIDRLIGYIKAI